MADIYAGGRSEEIVGSLMPELNRDGLILASKCSLPSGPAVTQFGADRKQIIAPCEESLKRLRTDYIDLYHIHVPDPVTPIEETLRATDDLVRQGKVRYTGSSMFFGWQLTKAQGVSGVHNIEKMVAGQYIYGLIYRELERETIPSEKLAIAWPLGRKFVTSVIIGVKTVDQLEANMAPADWDLPQDVWNELEERTRPEEEYMTWYQQFNNGRFFKASELHNGECVLYCRLDQPQFITFLGRHKHRSLFQKKMEDATMSDNKPKTLCAHVEEELQVKDPRAYIALIKPATHYCEGCGRSAAKAENVCKPQKF